MLKNKLLSELCTFGIGGPAKYFAEVRTVSEMQQILKKCHEERLPFLIIGKGSNCLFDDRGFDGVLILNKIDFLSQPTSGQFHAGSGYSFSLLGTQTARLGFSGLEFASGIPASVGGAVFMNAGANGRETCESLVSVDYVTPDGSLHLLKKETLQFSYRHSAFHGMQGAIVGASFHLEPSESARSKQIEIITYRKKTQPYGDMSAGCIFRNPSCGYAGALIEQSGLKGVQIGGAKVSEKHANFIVNTGDATSKDVLSLIEVIKQKVKDSTGIELESEVRLITYEGAQGD